MTSPLLNAAECIELYAKGIDSFFETLYRRLPEEGEYPDADELAERLDILRPEIIDKAAQARLLCTLYEQNRPLPR